MCLWWRLCTWEFVLKLSNSVSIKASPFTPIHYLEHQPSPDAMLSHFFLLFSCTFVSPFSSHLFVHFLLAWGSEDILCYLSCLTFLEWPYLCNRAWFCTLFAITLFHCSLVPLCSSCIWIKDWHSLYTLKPCF